MINPQQPMLETMSSSLDASQLTPVPVTLLSGFLGAGKTTLLRNILLNSQGLRIALIVNDVNSLNVDGAEISKHLVTQQDQKLVQLQNGCICCTLRVDLLEEIYQIAQRGDVDVIIIESTGVSEPQQVAETFTSDFSSTVLEESKDAASDIVKTIAKLPQGLSTIAKLDTCVTVLDVYNFFSNLDTFEMVKEAKPVLKAAEAKEQTEAEEEAETEEEESGTISELLMEQVEFADVIVLNKISLISPKDLDRVENTVRCLNPYAKILRCDYSNIDIQDVVKTGLFSLETAQKSAGWLQSLSELDLRVGFGADGKPRLTPKPETEEYGISSFIYSRPGRPFHPKRLMDLVIAPYFGLTQFAKDADAPQEDQDEDAEEIDGEYSDENQNEDQDDDDRMEEDDGDAECGVVPSEKILERRRNHPVFKGLYRSKGTFWLASRPYNKGFWSQAGALLTVEDGGSWDFMDQEDEQRSKGNWYDRRQEIVFIGEKLDKEELSRLLDECLLNDEEMKDLMDLKLRTEDDRDDYEGGLKFEDSCEEMFEDPFEPWTSVFEIDDEDDEEWEDEEDEKKNDDNLKRPRKQSTIKK